MAVGISVVIFSHKRQGAMKRKYKRACFSGKLLTKSRLTPRTEVLVRKVLMMESSEKIGRKGKWW